MINPNVERMDVPRASFFPDLEKANTVSKEFTCAWRRSFEGAAIWMAMPFAMYLILGSQGVVQAQQVSKIAAQNTLIPIIRSAAESRAKIISSLYLEYDRHSSDLPSVGSPEDSQRILHGCLCSYKLEGERIYYKEERQRFSSKGPPKVSRYETATDGNLSSSLHKEETEERRDGFIHKSAHSEVTRTLNSLGVRLFTYLNNSKVVGFKLDDLEQVGQEEFGKDKRDCVIFETASGARSNSSSVRLWICPELDYLVVQYQALVDGKVRVKVVIDYGEIETQLIPQKIVATRLMSDGRVLAWESSELLDCQLNPSFDPSDFTLKFPAGTVVHDARIEEEANSSGATGYYLIKADGSTRPILRSELGTSYDELLTTASGQGTGLRTNRIEDSHPQ